MMRAIRVMLSVGVASVAGTAMAQSADVSAASDVVVTGKRENREAQVRDFVRALNGLTGPDPIARFDRTELCPAAIGLSEAQDAAIVRRMRRIASAAAIPIAAEGCNTNALVIFADDKRVMIDALRKAHPAYFRTGLRSTLKVPDQPGPATAWHVAARLDRYGVQIPAEGERPLNGPDDFNYVTIPEGASRISANVRPIFVASVVVIERRAVDGLTVTQIGDYAAMRSFAEIDSARLKMAAAAPTILTVLDAPMESEVPLTLTAWDLGYLRALYAAPPLHSAYSQRAEMGRTLNRELDGAADKPR